MTGDRAAQNSTVRLISDEVHDTNRTAKNTTLRITITFFD